MTGERFTDSKGIPLELMMDVRKPKMLYKDNLRRQSSAHRWDLYKVTVYSVTLMKEIAQNESMCEIRMCECVK